MPVVPEFGQLVEWWDKDGPHPIPLAQHSLDVLPVLEAVRIDYAKVAQLGRAAALSEGAVAALQRDLADRYHQDVIEHEVTSTDPSKIVDRLAWVRSLPEWQAGISVITPDAQGNGGVYFNPADQNVYRCVQGHVTQADWRPDLPGVGALWVRYYAEEWPAWIQPAGAHDAYKKGAKVTHNGQRWTSSVDANTWAPGVFGWTPA